MDRLLGDTDTSTTAHHQTSKKSDRQASLATLPPPAESASQSTSGDEDVGEAAWWARADATLTEPAALARPELPTEARALENLLIDQFDGHDLTLPPLPRVPEVVLGKLNRSDCGLADVADDICEDQVCAAAVLRLANSPLYRGLEKITAIDRAVIRLGAGAIRTLMMHQTMRSIAGSERRSQHRFAETLSLRALASASVMRALSRLTGTDPEEAFLIGLLHNIGDVIVLRVVNSQRAFMKFDVNTEIFDYLCYESHQEFGELVADDWKLPQHLKSLIADHHRSPPEDDPLYHKRLQLQLSDMIGALLGYAPYAPYDLTVSHPAQELRLAEDPRFSAFLSALPGELDETMQAFA